MDTAKLLPGRPYIKFAGMVPMDATYPNGGIAYRSIYTVSVMAADLSRETIMATGLDYDAARELVKRLEYRNVTEQ